MTIDTLRHHLDGIGHPIDDESPHHGPVLEIGHDLTEIDTRVGRGAHAHRERAAEATAVRKCGQQGRQGSQRRKEVAGIHGDAVHGVALTQYEHHLRLLDRVEGHARQVLRVQHDVALATVLIDRDGGTVIHVLELGLVGCTGHDALQSRPVDSRRIAREVSGAVLLAVVVHLEGVPPHLGRNEPRHDVAGVERQHRLSEVGVGDVRDGVRDQLVDVPERDLDQHRSRRPLLRAVPATVDCHHHECHVQLGPGLHGTSSSGRPPMGGPNRVRKEHVAIPHGRFRNSWKPDSKS